MTNNICIIPARAGSERIPGKNIKIFRGRPIIQWVIETVIKSSLFDVVMCSTDSAQIAEIASRIGAETPFLRSMQNSSSVATTNDVLMEVLAWYKERGMTFSHACCMYPTAVFTTIEQLELGYTACVSSAANLVFPVAEYERNIYRALQTNSDGTTEFIFPENELTRTQDLPPALYDAGQWYWFTPERFLLNGRLFGGKTITQTIPRIMAHDIDTPEDWDKAVAMHSRIFPT